MICRLQTAVTVGMVFFIFLIAPPFPCLVFDSQAATTPQTIQEDMLDLNDNEIVYMGIDPGSNGGIAVLAPDGSVLDVTKMPDTPMDILEYIRLHSKGAKCIIEDVGHGIPGQSSSATAKFARHNGWLEMALLASGIPTTKVTPQKWQKYFQMHRGKDEEKTKYKNRLKERAQLMFPTVKVTLANADALLIAEYCRNKS